MLECSIVNFFLHIFGKRLYLCPCGFMPMVFSRSPPCGSSKGLEGLLAYIFFFFCFSFCFGRTPCPLICSSMLILSSDQYILFVLKKKEERRDFQLAFQNLWKSSLYIFFIFLQFERFCRTKFPQTRREIFILPSILLPSLSLPFYWDSFQFPFLQCKHTFRFHLDRIASWIDCVSHEPSGGWYMWFDWVGIEDALIHLYSCLSVSDMDTATKHWDMLDTCWYVSGKGSVFPTQACTRERRNKVPENGIERAEPYFNEFWRVIFCFWLYMISLNDIG